MRCGISLALILMLGLTPLAIGAHGADTHGAEEHQEEHHGGEGARVVNSALVFGGLFLLLRKKGRAWLVARGEQIAGLLRTAREKAESEEERLRQARERSATLEAEAREAESRSAAPLLEQAAGLEKDSGRELERLDERIEARRRQEYQVVRRDLLRQTVEQVSARAAERIPSLLSPEAQRGMVSRFLENLESLEPEEAR